VASKEDGFFTLYQMLGFNRILQAAGRLIRTEKDRGMIVLIDEQFMINDYTALFPDEWHPNKTIGNRWELKTHPKAFWEKN
jgi:DNA excision repair protein ERCC-2